MAAAVYPVNAVRAALGIVLPEPVNIIPADPATPAIFFDNDPAKIAEVRAYCNRIQLVGVNETPYGLLRVDESARATNPAYAPLWADAPLAANSYYRLHVANNVRHQPFDIRSGMQQPEFAIINDWVARTEGGGFARKAIFDWDRTLSMIEGVVIPDPINPLAPGTLRDRMRAYEPFATAGFVPENYLEDMLLYCCGGPVRLQTLRDMFAFLRSRGIMIVILTNSSACNDAKASYFRELMTALVNIPDYVPRIICGMDYGGHKGVAMRVFVPALCAGGMAGGRRTRRHRRKKRHTRRRR